MDKQNMALSTQWNIGHKKEQRNDMDDPATTWMNLVRTVPSERSYTQKVTWYMVHEMSRK
jgi:hypothetical protein